MTHKDISKYPRGPQHQSLGHQHLLVNLPEANLGLQELSKLLWDCNSKLWASCFQNNEFSQFTIQMGCFEISRPTIRNLGMTHGSPLSSLAPWLRDPPPCTAKACQETTFWAYVCYDSQIKTPANAHDICIIGVLLYDIQYLK